MRHGSDWSIAGRVFGVQVVAVLGVGAVLLAVLAVDAQQAAVDDAARLGLAVSSTIAADPAVHEALLSPDPSAALQPYALSTITAARVDFVTIMSSDGIRYTHPNPAEIGGRFLGTIAPAQAGGTLTETYTGTLGTSVRAVVPVMDGGSVIGLVSAGVLTDTVAASLTPRIPFIIAVSIAVVALGAMAAALTRRSLRRITGDLAPGPLQRMVGFYESVLRAVREGVVLTDGSGRVVLYNDEAAALLGLPPSPASMSAAEPHRLGIDAEIADLLASGRRVMEETHIADGRVLLVNQEPTPGADVSHAGRAPAVMTMRDQSSLQALVGELESVRTVSDALRAQAHEHANTLHAIVSLVELGRGEEVAGLVGEATRASQRLADTAIDDDSSPVLTAVLLGKAASASERGIALELDRDPTAALPLTGAETVSVVGNLVDNALEAALAGDPPRRVVVRIAHADDSVRIAVVDSGPGLADEVRHRVFELGVTTKPDDGRAHGLGLAAVRAIVDRHGGQVRFLTGSPTTVEVVFPVLGRTTEGAG